MVIWITGLSGTGKTTIGSAIFEKVKEKHINTIFLDGDIIRDLLGNYGYEKKDRLELAKKISNLCFEMDKQGINIVCSTISLFKEIHELNRLRFKKYYEIFIEVDFEELKRRDQKGIYTAALSGKMKNVVGIDIRYDVPKNPDLVIDNTKIEDLNNNIQKIIELINI